MDNEELDGVKFSEFPSQTPVNADEVVGLHSGDNARFSIANIVAAVRNGLANIFVPLTRTINGKGLSTDISLDSSDVGAVGTTDVGVANGVASLDSTGKVPSSQLPSIASTAADVTYDNTQSGLTATDVQEAIDELAQGGGGGGGSAASVTYDNTTSGLTATNVQDAIDEVSDDLEAKANQAQLATVETGNTASRAYAAGEYFCWNGLLYRVYSAISSGGTFTPGTNCISESVGDVFYRGAFMQSAYKYSSSNKSVSFTLTGYASGLLVFLPIYIRYTSGFYAGTVFINANQTTGVNGVGSSPPSSVSISGTTLTIRLPSAYAGVFIQNPMSREITSIS